MAPRCARRGDGTALGAGLRFDCMHLSGPRILLGLGFTVVAAVWLLAVRNRKAELSARLYQAGYVILGWFIVITILLFAGTGRPK